MTHLKDFEDIDYDETDYDYKVSNCTLAAIKKFPDLLTALAIICDQFLVTTVENLCYKLKVPYYIAGETFLAATTSAPELFVNMIATFVTEGDIGIGTIVGSSVFNTLAMPAILGLFSGVTAYLYWWPITRDIVWYIISIVALTCIIWDSIVTWKEALFMVCLFSLYLTTLIFDLRVQNLVINPKLHSYLSFKNTRITENCHCPNEYFINNDDSMYNICRYPHGESLSNKCIWCIIWPVYFAYYLTIPICRRDCHYIVCICSLIMCIIWISIETYMVSWMLTVLGYHFFVPDTIMGITFLALGASIPEAISGIIVTTKGYGSMSICNALSSNTYDILFCLGVPWLIKGYFFPKYPGKYFVQINSHTIAIDSATLLLSIIVLYLIFLLTNFVLNTRLGFICGTLYIIYLLYACIVEVNIFSTIHLPISIL
ncbi:sodium/potassium/calcium exchanger 4-like [Teleopsis dalmanni]|uniref:sodium/potassium/calcium exchanger 4-like n=1 Tax=Teleopsis dalmanni TaxID=139649 RepID=UPI0018CCC4DE|nr:sodium/potassium/calcium exchanger 4-like [Teleopsis dalmanni]